jgi:hypothetical protein
MNMQFNPRTLYASSARFDDTSRPMTNDEIRRIAPSVFATVAHESRSERFRAIPTIDVLDGLRGEGFFPVAVKQSRARDAGKAEYTKHLIRLRRFDDEAKKYSVGDVLPEILLKNANDGTSAYDLMSGLFRIRCLNSLVSQTATLDSVKVRHSGDAIGKVIEGTYRVLETSRAALAAPENWGQIQMNRDARLAYAEAAHILRFGDAEGNVDTAFRPEQLLQTRRRDDDGADLWTITNVVQENVIRGGLRARVAAHYDDEGGYVPARRVSTREVKGIDQDVRLNKALWVLSEKMAEVLRQAA